MDNYSLLLALAYLNQYKSKYILSDLMQILGMTAKQFDELMSELFERGYIEYSDFLLSITVKGRTCLVASNMYKYNNEETDLNMLHVRKDSAISIEKAYVPNKFFSKLGARSK